MCTIAMEEYELMKDSKYRVYVSAVDKALKSFDYTSEWADLISALGKLNKVLIGHQKFPVIPRRIKISKRLAQCMHPALPSGVHLKALETYDIIFRCMGTNRLSHELFIYSAGLFPLLAHSAMNVRPSLLTVYETHFVPLGERLRPGLSGFLSGVLPGLDEGSDHFQRTNALLEKVCEGVGATYFYGCVWDCVAANAAIRLPAISFVGAHFNRKLPTEDQRHVMGNNADVMVSALAAAAQDASVLVQRAALDLLLAGFPLHASTLPGAGDAVRLVQAALAAILRRDMSLNRRLFAWLLGTEVNLSLLSNDHPLVKRSKTDGAGSLVGLYFDLYSRDTLVQAVRATLAAGLGRQPQDLRPFRLLVSLLDKPDIGPVILDSILCDVFRALYLDCGGLPVLPGNQELVRCANLLFSTLQPRYIWQHCAALIAQACADAKGNKTCADNADIEPCADGAEERVTHVGAIGSGPPNLLEICELAAFLLDAVSLETHPDSGGQHLPGLFLDVIEQLTNHSAALTTQQIGACLRLAAKIVSRVSTPPTPPPAPSPPPSPRPPGHSQSEAGDRTRANSDLSEYKQSKAVKSKMKKSKTEAAAAVEGRKLRAWDSELAAEGPAMPSVEAAAHRSANSLGGQVAPEDPTPAVASVASAAVTLAVPSKEQVALLRCQRQYQRCFQRLVADDQRTLNGQTDRLFARLQPSRPRDTERDRADELHRLLSRCLHATDGTNTTEVTDATDAIDARDKPSEAELPISGAELGGGPADEGAEIFPAGDSAEMLDTMSAACSLLVQLAAFPTVAADAQSQESIALPDWLRSLLCCACFVTSAPRIQLTAAQTLVDLMHRARDTDVLAGTETLLSRRHLHCIERQTSAVKTLAWSLWELLGRCSLHLQPHCVKLLLRLHSASRCDDVDSVVGEALAAERPALRTEAFRRFQALWHFGRDFEKQGAKPRTLDKCLLKMLDHLSVGEPSPLRLEAQSWLVASLQRGDISRVLDPLLSMLLDPATARLSVLHVRVQPRNDCPADASSTVFAISSEDGHVIYHTQPRGRSQARPRPPPRTAVGGRQDKRGMALCVNPFADDDAAMDATAFGAGQTPACSEPGRPWDRSELSIKSEAARKLGHDVAHDDVAGLELASIKRWSSCELEMSTPAEEFFQSAPVVVAAVMDDILDRVVLRCEANAAERERNNATAFHPIHQHMLLYCGVYDSNRTLYALDALRSVIVTNARMFVCCAAATGLASAAASSQLIGLLARHRKSVFGKSFAGEASVEFGAPYRSSMYLEVVISVCLYFARSFYPNLGQMRLTPEEIAGNRQVQLASAELLTLASAELAAVARDGGKGCANYVSDMLARCKVVKVALHCLYSSVSCMRNQQANSPRSFTEEIVSFNDPPPEGSDGATAKCQHQGSEHSEGFQIQLLRLVLSLVMLEHQVNAVKNADSADAAASAGNASGGPQRLRYLPGVPVPQQPMFLSSVVTALQLKHCRHLHQHWNALVTSALPFMGPSLPEVVLKVTEQLCDNLEQLAAACLSPPHSLACCQPADYATTQLEALTALTHFCLLDSAQHFQLMSGGAALVPGANPAQVFNNLLHVFMPPPIAQALDVAGSKDKPALTDHHLLARRSALSNLPRIVASVATLWEAVATETEARAGLGNGVLGNQGAAVRHRLLELLSPIALHHGVSFLSAVAVVWHRRRPPHAERNVIPVASAEQQVLVGLVSAIRVLPIDTMVQTVHQVVKQPAANANANAAHSQETTAWLEASVLELFYSHVATGTQRLAESWPSLLALLRDGLTLTPPAQFLLLAVLNQFIQRCPPLADKKDQRDLQDITAKLVESCSCIAGSCLEQTTWLRRNLAVRQEDLAVTGTKMDSAATPLAQYSVQAQSVLAELLAPLLDVSYGSQEKERVVALLTTLMTNIVPYLKNHTERNAGSYRACAALLSSLSGFQYMRKAWRRDALELLLEPTFFRMEPQCLPLWRNIVDNLMTHDNTTFRELMGKLGVAQGTGLSIFSSREAEYEVRTQLLKRLAFVVLCSETDQYQKHMPEIQERLADSVRLPAVNPSVQAAVFLCCRVLLLRMSPQHVTSLWPVIIAEMVQVFLHIEQELATDTEQFTSHIRLLSALDSSWVVNANNGLHAQGHPHWAQLQLAAAKLLDIALLLPASQLPQFQMYRWAFVGDADSATANNNDDGSARTADFVPHVERIARLMDAKYACPFVPLSAAAGQPLLTTRSVRSLRDLRPFFAALSSRCADRAPPADLDVVEAVVERDFLEPA